MKYLPLFIPLFLMISLHESAAQITSSPYSLFAEGLITNSGTGTNHAIGGCGIALRSRYSLNSINPASYSGIDSLSFIFETGLFGRITQYKTRSETQKRHDANLLYMAMGCRITSWWSSSIGFIPFSAVGYEINSLNYVEGELSVYKKIYEGSGGINRFYWGNSFKVYKNFSLGMNLSYYLGSMEYTETGTTLDKILTYTISNQCNLHTAQLDYGVQYFFHIKDTRLILGAIYGNYKELSITKEYKIGYKGDTINLENSKEKYSIPMRYGVGIGFENSYKFRAGFDYERKTWHGANTFTNTLLKTRDAERLSFGLEYTPNKGYNSELWRSIFYRLGANYNKTYLVIDKIPINSYALVFGAGIPLRRELTLINVSVETGRIGTTQKGLIKENYVLMRIDFTLNEKWFIRPYIE
jgi:hypothetical protein